MSDPLDDLLRTPDDDGRPYDEVHADVPADVAALVFAAARARCERELAEALERADGDEAKVIGYRLVLQRAIDAQAWVAAQRGATVPLAVRPVDVARDLEAYERWCAENPESDDDDPDGHLTQDLFPPPAE